MARQRATGSVRLRLDCIPELPMPTRRPPIMFTTASAPVSANAPPEPAPLDYRNILPPPTPPPSTLIDLTTESDDSEELPECFDVVRISAREIKMCLSMPNCLHVARLLDKRRVSVNPISFKTDECPSWRRDGTTWLALRLQTLQCLDKPHQKLCFSLLDGHITIGYPPTVDWEYERDSILAIIGIWIHQCKEEFRNEHENPTKLVGWLEFLEEDRTHDRFGFVSLNIHPSDPLHSCLEDLSARIWTQHRWFEVRRSFHISINDSDHMLCEEHHHMV